MGGLLDCWIHEKSPIPKQSGAHWDHGLGRRSADWQSAVSRIGNPQGFQIRIPADCQSAAQQVANLRYKVQGKPGPALDHQSANPIIPESNNPGIQQSVSLGLAHRITVAASSFTTCPSNR
jgi:hypothetical protein